MLRLNTFIRFILFILFSFSKNGFSQTAREVGVEIKATLISKKYLKLSWMQQSGSTKYEVFSKSSNLKDWDLLATLSGADTNFVDTTYVLGTVKEYRVARTSTNYTGFTGNGYILSGFEVPATRHLGIVLVVIDSNYMLPLKKEINEYLDQIQNEGYQIITHYVSRNAKISDIKNWIFQKWLTDSNSIKSIFLLGRVPVPYSGNFRPDGHTDHTGAWAADLYYGNFYSAWTDATVNNSQATYKRNHNTPGDGKFDVSRVNPTGTSADKIQYQQIPVGRVDLFDMIDFGNDTMLIKQYLKKALAYRTGTVKFENRALVDDHFGYNNSEAFASGGFRNFSPFTRANISTDDYRTKLKSEKYLLSYGCGPGSYTSASGISTTADFVTDSLLNPFTLTFGSYFGDWDNSNNFLRAPLASKGWGLMSVWSGRPYWSIHECALGLPLYKAVLTTNNSYNIYNSASFISGVHVALMGDPTLRMFVVENVRRFSAKANCNQELEIKWKSNPDADSLYLEEYQTQTKTWKLIQKLLPQDSIATIKFPKGKHLFSLRYLQLMNSASGTWWQWGARDTFSVEIDSFPQSRITGNIQNRYCALKTYYFQDSSNFENGELSSWESAGYHYDTVSNVTFYSTNYAYGGYTDYLLLHRWSKTGCYRVDTIVIQLNNSRIDLLTSMDSVCSGKEVTLTYKTQLNGAKWLVNGTFETSDSILNLLGKPTGSYEVELTARDSNDCYMAGKDTIHILKSPIKPVIRIIQNSGKIGDTVKLEVLQIADVYEFNWLGNNQLSSSNQLVFVPQTTGEVVIDCKLINQNGCESDTGILKMNFMVNESNLLSKSNLSWFPNPVAPGEVLRLEIPTEMFPENSSLNLICRDISGREIAKLNFLESDKLSNKLLNSTQFLGNYKRFLHAVVPDNLEGLYVLELNGQIIGKLIVSDLN